mmetsp:Transcript_21717/g.43088  ORF Transcript_21717/g.43088 Transcript_21717/m.43088 type:complete len:331 (+) Transcript_21717:44-1036(+)
MPEKRKRGDPRRRSFFSTRPGEEKKKRRRSTSRPAEITQLVDGFEFRREGTKKQKRSKREEEYYEEDDTASPTAPAPRRSARNSSKKKAAPPKPVVKKTKVKVPPYPKTQFDAANFSTTETSASSFFDHLITEELKAVSKAYKGKFAFVANSISEVAQQFLKQLEQTEAGSSSSSSSNPSIQSNPKNDDLKSQQQMWTDFIAKGESEVGEWQAIQSKLASLDAAAADKENAVLSDQECQALLSKEDQELLKGNAKGVLSQTLTAAYQAVSVHSDDTLKSLRRVSASAADAEVYLNKVGAKINATALAPFSTSSSSSTASSDQIKSLIKDV